MSGQYAIPIVTSGSNGSVGNNYTLAQQGSFDVPVWLRSVTFTVTYGNRADQQFRPVVYDANTKVADGEILTVALTDTTATYEAVFTSGVPLTAGKVYLIGVYCYYTTVNSHARATYDPYVRQYQSTPAYATWTMSDAYDAYYYYVSGDGFPVNKVSAGSVLQLGFTVDGPNASPTAPTGVTATDAAVGSSSTVGWTHNDPDGDPQAQYQLRWRKVIP